MNLAKEISFLLYNHDCVILPEFGAFIVQKRVSEKNEIVSYAKPVSHTITFNNQITNNDGLMINRVSIVEKCSFNEAQILLSKSIEELRDRINQDKSIELLGVGTFYLTQEGKLIFIPYHTVNFCKASFGLPKIKFSKLEKTMNEEPLKSNESRPSIPKTPTELQPNEIDTPVLVQKQQENKRKYEELQARRLEKKSSINSVSKSSKKFKGLTIINSLGAICLIAMAVGLFIFEKNLGDQQAANDQIASILNVSNKTANYVNSTSEPASYSSSEIVTFGIYATTTSGAEAAEFLIQIENKYEDARIADENNEVHIISFDDEALAIEYKNLLQNKLNQTLIVK